MHFESLLTFKQLVMLKIQYIRPFLFSFFMYSGKRAFSQQVAVKQIQFKPVFGKLPLFLNDTNYQINKSVFKFKNLKFYVSYVQLLLKNRVVYSSDCYYLIDVLKPKSLIIPLYIVSNVEFDTINFDFGLDNLTNIIDAMGEDNDMTKKGQSGCFNFKLEGSSEGKEFQFHLGSSQEPFQTWQEIKLKAHNSETTDVYFDLKEFVETIEIAQLNRIIPPSQEAKEMSEKLAQCFY